MICQVCCGFRFGKNSYNRQLFFFNARKQLRIFVIRTKRAVDNENGNIGFVKYLYCFLYTLSAELTFVVNTRGINNHNWPERQNFHGLVNGVGGSAFGVGYYGEVLPCNGVNKAWFAGIALAENAYVDAFRGWGSV